MIVQVCSDMQFLNFENQDVWHKKFFIKFSKNYYSIKKISVVLL